MTKGTRKVYPVNDGKTILGMHLMLDAYGVAHKPLDDMKLVFKYLNTLPAMIGMSILSTPNVVDAEETASKLDPGGISGIVMIAESHISIHTFAKRGFFSMDLYSCSNFEDDVDTVMEYTKKIFPRKKHHLQIVKRGLEYPVHNVEEIK